MVWGTLLFLGVRMKYSTLVSAALIAVASLATTVNAENHVGLFGGETTYASEECNKDPEYLTENDIVCTAVFSSTRVWDFLDNLQRRITLPELAELNPGLGEIDFETVISGITFVRVR